MNWSSRSFKDTACLKVFTIVFEGVLPILEAMDRKLEVVSVPILPSDAVSLTTFVKFLCYEMNLVINELFSGIVSVQHAEHYNDVGILMRNKQQISDLKRGRTSALNLWRFVLDTLSPRQSRK